MPESAFKGAKSRDSWTQDIIKEFEKLEFNKGKKTPKEVIKAQNILNVLHARPAVVKIP